jgi:hypothetical protein
VRVQRILHRRVGLRLSLSNRFATPIRSTAVAHRREDDVPSDDSIVK